MKLQAIGNLGRISFLLLLFTVPPSGKQLAHGTVQAGCSITFPPLGMRVLVLSKTAGFRHASIQAGKAALVALGVMYKFGVELTEDSMVFHDAYLSKFAVVVFLNTSGGILGPAQKNAFERYVKSGGGFVGVHSAADTEHDWAWYGQLVGARFLQHPPVQVATVRVNDTEHPSTRCLPRDLSRTDEWYDFRALPANVHVLAAVDERSYTGGKMGPAHPISWSHRFDGGRAWYTAMGHTSESYEEPAFLTHLAGGILWASGQ